MKNRGRGEALFINSKSQSKKMYSGFSKTNSREIIEAGYGHIEIHKVYISKSQNI